MAPHSSTLAWKIPWMEEPGTLQSMGSLRVGQDWATSLSLFTFMHWRRKWQPTPVFLPGESQGRGEPGGSPSMGLHRVGHDWSELAAAVGSQRLRLNDRRDIVGHCKDFGFQSSVRWKVIDVFSAVWYLIFWKDHCNYCAKSKLEGASEGIGWEVTLITQVRDKDGFEQWREDNDWIWGEFWSQPIGFHARLNIRCERKELRMTLSSWLCKPLEA